MFKTFFNLTCNFVKYFIITKKIAFENALIETNFEKYYTSLFSNNVNKIKIIKRV